MNVALYSPHNAPIVAFEKDALTTPFICSNNLRWGLHEIHQAEVTNVYVAGVRYERDADGRKLRAVMEITGDDIGKIEPDLYTVYTISNTDTPTRAETDHKRRDKAIVAGGELAARLGLPLELRLAAQ